MTRLRVAPTVTAVPPRPVERAVGVILGGGAGVVLPERTRLLLEQVESAGPDADRSALAIVRDLTHAQVVLDQDGTTAAHRAVAVSPAAARMACQDHAVASLPDVAGRRVAHTAVLFHEDVARAVWQQGDHKGLALLELTDGTAWSVLHAAVTHVAVALAVVDAPKWAGVADVVGWTVAHEAARRHVAFGAMVLRRPGVALWVDDHAATVAAVAVISHPEVAAFVLREFLTLPEPVRLWRDPNGFSLRELATLHHGPTLLDLTSPTTRRRGR